METNEIETDITFTLSQPQDFSLSDSILRLSTAGEVEQDLTVDSQSQLLLDSQGIQPPSNQLALDCTTMSTSADLFNPAEQNGGGGPTFP